MTICPTCGRSIESVVSIAQLARWGSDVDRAVRVRQLAVKRDRSPFEPPPSVQDQLRRAA